MVIVVGVGEVGEKAVGAQVALVDEKQVTPADVGNNFFIYKEDIGKTRAVVSVGCHTTQFVSKIIHFYPQTLTAFPLPGGGPTFGRAEPRLPRARS